MFKFLTSFLTKMAGRLGGMAWASKSGRKGKDLHGDVWLAASEIEEKRGHPVDFENPVDQELLMSRVYSLLKKERDGRLASAVSLDAECEQNVSWGDRIPETTSMDPISVWSRRDAESREEKKLAASFSQAAAYVVVFSRFKSDQNRICDYLAIARQTLSRRLLRASQIVASQPSLFDGIHSIGEDFMPLPGRPKACLGVDADEEDRMRMLF